MKHLLLLLLVLTVGCASPKKVVEFEYWSAVPKSIPQDFTFPSELMGSNNQIEVDVEIAIDSKGLPSSANSITQNNPLSKIAEWYSMSCTYRPALLNKEGYPSKLRMKVVFYLPTKAITVWTIKGERFRSPEF